MSERARTGVWLSCIVIALVQSSDGLAATGLPFVSSFESGDFREWFWGRDAALAISDSDSVDGVHAARYELVEGTRNDNYKDYYFGDHASIGQHVKGEGVGELWLRFYNKIERGYQYPSGTHKLVLFNLTDGVRRQRRYQVYIGIYNGVYAVEHSYVDTWRFFGLPQNCGAAISPRAGEWDKLKMYVRMNTPGVRDGVVRMWINDELKVDYTDVDIRQRTSFYPNKLIMSSHTEADGGDGVQWQDAFYLGEVDPDVLAPASP